MKYTSEISLVLLAAYTKTAIRTTVHSRIFASIPGFIALAAWLIYGISISVFAVAGMTVLFWVYWAFFFFNKIMVLYPVQKGLLYSLRELRSMFADAETDVEVAYSNPICLPDARWFANMFQCSGWNFADQDPHPRASNTNGSVVEIQSTVYALGYRLCSEFRKTGIDASLSILDYTFYDRGKPKPRVIVYVRLPLRWKYA